MAEANGPYTINMYDGTVTLDATGSYDPDGDDLAFVWAVGDHAAAEMTDPLYTLSWADFISTFGYMGCGDYAVTLSVRDTTGLWGADASSITVTPEPCTLMLLAGGCLALCRRRRR